MNETGVTALSYLDAQIEALRQHVPTALGAFDTTGIHQARVATRRLKAALNLLESLCEPEPLKTLNDAGRKLRRRLGPLRDMDVMILALGEGVFPPSLVAPRDWLTFHCQATRAGLQARDREIGASPERLLRKFDQWWVLRAALVRQAPSIVPLLTQSLHDQFSRFSDDAARLMSQPEHLDVHQLRIDGKLLRYTIEVAQAAGVDLPGRIVKQFKQLQEDLGEWHDRVVLAEQVLKVMKKQEILLHDAAAGVGALDLAKHFVKQSERHLKAFVARWQKLGAGIESTLHEKLPIVRVMSTEKTAREEAGRVQPVDDAGSKTAASPREGVGTDSTD